MSVEGPPPRVLPLATPVSLSTLCGRALETAADEAIADAASGAYIQNRDCSKGMDNVVTELDDVSTDSEEGMGRSLWGRAVRGKYQVSLVEQ